MKNTRYVMINDELKKAVMSARAGDRGDIVFVLQERVPQQGDVFHDAADRGEVQPRRAREHDRAPLLGHQAPPKGACPPARVQLRPREPPHTEIEVR